MKTLSLKFIALVAVVLSSLAVALGQSATAPLTLTVDETQAYRQIAFVHEEIPVTSGTLSLAYPRWIPGEHGPTGEIQQVAALRIYAGDKTLPWTRDPDDIYTFHVEVPPGTDRISVDFDTLVENTISDHQILLNWNTVLLYPRSADMRRLTIEPSVILPTNWKQGGSLQVTNQSGSRITFSAVSLERLIDSPILAGEFFRAVPLKASWPAELDVTGDSPAAVASANDAHAFEIFGKLIDQDRAMFGYRHWQTMHILVSQSDARPYDGLEHEDAPYNAVPDAALSKKDKLQKLGWPLLAHEQSHSWCGKYRRPAELYSKPNYQGPERTTLLWVYEGLNTYIGMMLSTRSGFDDPAYMRDYLGRMVAEYSQEPGRATTSVLDTATDSWVLRPVDPRWHTLRRSQDYYGEAALIWLRADTIIREKTKGQRSLDDFLRAFLGQRDTGPIVAPYTREDVESALGAICPYDWHSFFETRIYQVNPKPPIEGIEAAGWRLVYNSTPNNESIKSELIPMEYSAEFSIGLSVRKGGSIYDVIPGTPAYEAGLGPDMTIVAVDGRAYSPEVLNESISHPKNGTITLTVRNFDSIESHDIHYAGGVRYPHLERIPGSHDYLSEILAPRN